MRFISVKQAGRAATGLLHADGRGQLLWADAPGYPGTLDALVAQGPAALQAAGQAIAAAPLTPLDGLTWLPPLQASGKVICIGLNYADHSRESGFEPPGYPAIFSRYAGNLIGHGAAIQRPGASEQLDYEGELVAVIGTAGRHIPVASALDHVLGYSVFNDGSVRDFQFKSAQWTIGKNFDHTGAFGPALVTADELPAGCKGLRLQTRLNGQVVQSASTDDMIFDVATLVSMLSVAHALQPGDIIVTGTPAGVGLARKPPLWMKPGDVCEIEIERVGLLRNPVVQAAE